MRCTLLQSWPCSASSPPSAKSSPKAPSPSPRTVSVENDRNQIFCYLPKPNILLKPNYSAKNRIQNNAEPIVQISHYSVSAEYSVRYSAEYFGSNRFRLDSRLQQNYKTWLQRRSWLVVGGWHSDHDVSALRRAAQGDRHQLHRHSPRAKRGRGGNKSPR